jgi:AraC-like DNA-binding protein
MSPLYTRLEPAELRLKAYSPSDGSTVEPGVTTPVILECVVRDSRLRRVIQIIESGALSTVHALAVEVDLSASYLQHFFKQQTGVCITQLLTEQRLQRAAYLLKASNMSVKQIACAVGYEHASSFVRAFRRCFAQTPRAYRREIGQHTLLTNGRFG